MDKFICYILRKKIYISIVLFDLKKIIRILISRNKRYSDKIILLEN